MGEQDAWIRDGAERDAPRREINEAAAALALLDAAAGPAERTSPKLRPRPAAALILVEAAGGVTRVLMGRRNSSLAFMADKFVFPGGRVDRADRRMEARGCLPELSERALRAAGCDETAGRALALAAIRETFEETGLVLGAPAVETAPISSEAWRGFAAHGMAPRLDGLRLVARAITPPGRVRRFDTWFFAAEASEINAIDQRAASARDELLDISWFTIEEAESLPLAAITRVVLRDVARDPDLGRAKDRPIPFYRQLRGRWRRDEL